MNKMQKINFQKIYLKNIFIFFSIFYLLFCIQKIFAKDQYSIKDLSKLIKTNICDKCNLEGVDLVNKDLSYAQITNSNLKNANLSGGLLDNINFRGSNLSGSSLKNASIRNGQFLNTNLNGTDFQYSDLTNSLFDFEALNKSLWTYSIGIKSNFDTFENFYNSGVKHYYKEEFLYAIELFSFAIEKDPTSIESYLSRAIINFNLERYNKCLLDLTMVNKLMINSNNIKYQKTISNLNQIITEKKKKKNKTAEKILKTIVQSYSLFRFL